MAKEKTEEEKYKDVPHYELIVKDGEITIPSIFMFSECHTEYYLFIHACSELNCTVHLENEGLTIKPGDDDMVRRVKELSYFQMAQCPKMVEHYLRYLLNQDKMKW